MKKLDVWFLTPRLCIHGVRKHTRLTTSALEGEKPRKHLLVEPSCGKIDCPIQMFEIPREEN